MTIILEEELPSLKELKEEKERDKIIIGGKNQLIQRGTLKIAIVNLMPDKNETEVQFLKLLSNIPYHLSIKFIRLKTHSSRNTSTAYLEKYYYSFDEIQEEKFDGMIITGAPLENIAFQEVDYWEELKEIFNYARYNVSSTLMICWSAIAGLYHYYGIPKKVTNKKVFGVFQQKIVKVSKLFDCFPVSFVAPHSRYFQLEKKYIDAVDNIEVLSESQDAGIFVVASRDGKEVYVTGHLEYSRDTLLQEFTRDQKRGTKIKMPQNYFQDNDPKGKPLYRWEKEAKQFFYNWITFYVKKGGY